MESTLCSDNELSMRPPKIFIKRSLARPDRSLSPTLFYEKSLPKLPPLRLTGNPSLNKTPPPNTKGLNLIQTSNRVKSIVLSSIFPEMSNKQVKRAPSVGDLLPPLTRISSGKDAKCARCGKECTSFNDVQMNEFKIWSTCPDCQDQQFPTSPENDFFDIITFQTTGEYQEFALEANIPFWMEGQIWPSALECIEKLGKAKAFKINLQKVKQHPRLELLLKATGSKDLIHLLPGNKYWGVSFNGIGANRLGKILMDVREELCGNHELM